MNTPASQKLSAKELQSEVSHITERLARMKLGTDLEEENGARNYRTFRHHKVEEGGLTGRWVSEFLNNPAAEGTLSSAQERLEMESGKYRGHPEEAQKELKRAIEFASKEIEPRQNLTERFLDVINERNELERILEGQEKGRIGNTEQATPLARKISGDAPSEKNEVEEMDWSPYEGQSEYEKEMDWSPYEDQPVYEGRPLEKILKETEDMARMISSITKVTIKATQFPVAKSVAKKPQPAKKDQAAKKPQPAKKDQAAKKPQATNNSNTLDTIIARAFVVHGIPCWRYMEDIVEDVRNAGLEGITGARWLVGRNRRAGKTASSVVIFLNRVMAYSFSTGGGGPKLKIRGRSFPLEVYDFNRGRGWY